MQLISTYSPPSFMKPVVIFSTLAHETAICFIEALHGQHALKILFKGEQPVQSEKPPTDYFVIKKHKTPEDALAFHSKIALTYRNGESEKLWDKGWKPYLKLYDKYYPEHLKDKGDGET